MDYLSAQEQEQLEVLRRSDHLVEESLQQLKRILDSLTFGGLHQHARNFLSFVVVKQLLGEASEIKETTVAVHVFGEAADYDPKEHTKVRVAAGTLRQRLERYYQSEGKDQPIVIEIPIGTYVPLIRDRRWRIAVSVFDNWNAKGDHDHLCHAAADEVAHRLGQTRGGIAERVTGLDANGHLHDYGLRGSLECSSDRIRLNYSLSDLRSGMSVMADHVKGHRDDLLRLSQEIAAAVASELQRRHVASDSAHDRAQASIRRPRDPRIRTTRVQTRFNSKRPDVA